MIKMTTRKILVVDDSKNIRKLITVILKNEGFEFIEAANGLDALSKARLEHPDLAILDIIIPGANGIKVCREIKKDPIIGAMPVIILTSEATYEAMESARAAGADMYLTKPFEPSDLKKAVKTLLK